jgi:CubicO group peptidase (beta-lactamase class C family)
MTDLAAILAAHFDADGPGAALAVLGADGSAETACRGLARGPDGPPITPDTLFELASASKWFTAAAALRLCEAGALALDALVGEHLASFARSAAGARAITLRDLLQHTSGLADYLELGMYADPADLTRASIEARLPDWIAAARPGEAHAYSNTNYHVVAELIDRVHPRGFAGALDALFTASGMKRSRRLGIEAAAGARNVGLVAPVFEAVEDLPTDVVGDGGVVSSLSELCAWMRAARDGSALKASSLQEMTRPGRLDDGSDFDYGLGLELQREDGVLIGYGHTGSWTNTTTCLLVDVRTNSAVIVLSNQFMAPVVAIAQAALRRVS